MDDRMTLAALRVRAGYTQAEVAHRIGVSKDSIQKWEKDSRQLPARYIKDFTDLYQIGETGIFIGDATALSERIQAAYRYQTEAETNASEA